MNDVKEDIGRQIKALQRKLVFLKLQEQQVRDTIEELEKTEKELKRTNKRLEQTQEELINSVSGSLQVYQKLQKDLREMQKSDNWPACLPAGSHRQQHKLDRR